MCRGWAITSVSGGKKIISLSTGRAMLYCNTSREARLDFLSNCNISSNAKANLGSFCKTV